MTIEFTPEDPERFCVPPSICLVCEKELFYFDKRQNGERFGFCRWGTPDHRYEITVSYHEYREEYFFKSQAATIINHQNDLDLSQFYVYGPRFNKSLSSSSRIILKSLEELENFLILQ